MTDEDIESLRESVYRATASDSKWLGYWLGRFISSERLSWNELSSQLGIPLDGVATLSLCRTPRPDYFQEDVLVVCERTGANVNELIRIIRQEQAMERWSQQKTESPTGWLLAASDAPEDLPPERGTEAGGDAT